MTFSKVTVSDQYCEGQNTEKQDRWQEMDTNRNMKERIKQNPMQRANPSPEIVLKVRFNSSIITAQRRLSYLCCGSILN